VFKTEAILLHSHKIRDNTTRYIFLTKEYWKISCFYKKGEKIWSSWDIVLILIERKEGINTIKNVEIQTSIQFRKTNYVFIISFLWVIKILYEFIADSEKNESIFNDYKEFIKYLSLTDEPLIQDSIFFQIRLLKKLWFINGDELIKQGHIERYIYRHIDIKNIQLILWSKKLDDSIIEFLEKVVYKTIYQILL
jgi:recombinational DNA repair protein (RecF pathway)